MHTDGATALRLDFGTVTTTTRVGRGKAGLRLAPSAGLGPDKYKAFEHQRRQAQIKARRLLDLMEEAQ